MTTALQRNIGILSFDSPLRHLFSLVLTMTCADGVVRRSAAEEPAADDLQRELVGHWKLDGDCRDYSGRGNHGTNHGVDLRTGTFVGRVAFIEVPNSYAPKLGRGEFSIAALVKTEAIVDDNDTDRCGEPALNGNQSVARRSGDDAPPLRLAVSVDNKHVESLLIGRKCGFRYMRTRLGPAIPGLRPAQTCQVTGCDATRAGPYRI